MTEIFETKLELTHGFISISYLLVTIPQTAKGKWEEMAYLDAFQACFTISEQDIIIKIIP